MTEKRLTKKLMNKDWFIFVERKQPFFLMPNLFKPYHELLKRETGTCFLNQIYYFKDGTLYYLRSRNEFGKVKKYLVKFLLDQNNYQIIEDWAKSAKKLNIEADKEIEYYRLISITDLKDPIRYSKFLDFFQEVFFFSTLIPYFVLDAAEYIIKTSKRGAEIERAKKIIKRFEPIRGQSHYFQMIAGIADRYWQHILTIRPEINQVELLLPNEITEILQNEFVPSEIKQLNRRNNCLMYLENEGKIFLDYHVEDIENFLPKFDVACDIKGTASYKGLVSGTVKIVNIASEIGKVNKGDIIVSINTNPILMPALKKAFGIVTDDGGITCHAAIISRELKIPCIVGTKISTKVLKDGDLVEVNANSGVVKILKRA